MAKKELCITCSYDKDCTFPRRFPVLQCEEFSDYQPTAVKARGNALKCSRRRENRCTDTETTESFD